MGFRPEARATARRSDDVARADAYAREAADLARRMIAALPDHREMLEHAKTRGMPRI